MAFSFEISKPRNIEEVENDTREKIEADGGTFDLKSKRFSNGGVEGFYSVGSNSVTVTITQKPMFAPESLVKSRITDYFRGK